VTGLCPTTSAGRTVWTSPITPSNHVDRPTVLRSLWREHPEPGVLHAARGSSHAIADRAKSAFGSSTLWNTGRAAL
jgi:hypothetical protein